MNRLSDLLAFRVGLTRFFGDMAATIVSRTGELILRVWCASWRKDVEQLSRLDGLLSGNGPVLVVFWHGKYFPLFALMEGRAATVIVAQSFRGKVIAKLARRFGYHAAMIPGDGASDALFVRSAMAATKTVALAVDGPLGPRHRVKPNLIRLAAEQQFLIVPVSVASQPRLILRKRWDKREMPYPFAKVALKVGEPSRLPRALEPSETVEWTERVQDALVAADEDAEALLRR